MADWLCPRCLLGQAAENPVGDDPVEEGIAVASAPRVVQYFGDYELLEEIARGGMGVVYEARQVSLNRTVAVKFLLFGRLAGGDVIKRFRVEAEAAASLQHPNIVAIHEVGEHDGQHYFSMDYVAGDDLSDLVREKPLPAKRAAGYLQRIAEAIHFAHGKGILHRDLKPSNILIDADDQPRITDFGLAKRLTSELQTAGENPHLTITGQILGTPGFMSPEQAGSKRGGVGPAADVYSLGALLYFLVTGRAPFAADSLEETLRQVHESEPVSPRLLNPGLSRDLETICLKCLSKEPSRRYSSALALAEDLGRWLRHEPIRARPIGTTERLWRWCRRKPALSAALGACALAVTLGISGISWQWERAETEARQKSGIAEENRRRLVRINVSNGLKSLEDGDSFGALPWFVEALSLDAGDALREEPHRMRIASALAASPRIVHSWFHDDAIEHAEFSPDGRQVLTASRDGTARVWNTITGHETISLAHGSSVQHATFNFNATLIATATYSNTARVWDAATGRPVTPFLQHAGSVRRVAFSPDGLRLLTVSADHTARIWDAVTGDALSPALKHSGSISAGAFSPDGTMVATLSADETARVWDARTGAALSTITAMTPNVYDVRFSDDSRQVLAAGYAVARLADVKTGKSVIPALVHAQAVTSASFSPDGQRLLTSSDDRTICIWDANTGRPTTSPIKLRQSAKHASFSPDGQWVIHAGQDGVARIWSARDSTPSGPPLRHTRRLRRAWFSPDGRFVLTAGFDGMARLWAPPLGQPSQVVSQGDRVRAAAFNPDGTRLVTGGGSNPARVWNTATGLQLFTNETRLSAVNDAMFSPDGARVLLASLDGKTASVTDAQTGRELFSLLHTANVVRALFTPDNRRIVTCSSVGARVATDHRRVLATQTNSIVQTWDAISGQALTPPLPLPGTADPFALSPDGSRILTGLTNGTVLIWETMTGAPVTSPIRLEQPGKFAQFSPDSQLVATTDGDANSGRTVGAIEIWEAATGQRVGATIRNKGGFFAAAFSPDSRRLVSASSDGTARVWDVRTGAPLTAPLVHRWDVLDAAFSEDGRYVVTASADTSACVWDALAGEPVTPMLPHGGYVIRALFHPKILGIASWAGQSVRSSRTSEETVHLWSLPREGRSVEELRQLVQLFAAGQVDVSGKFAPLEPEAARHLWETVRARFPGDFGHSAEEVRAAADWESNARRARSVAFLQSALAAHPNHPTLRETLATILSLRTGANAETNPAGGPVVAPAQNTTWDSFRAVRTGLSPRPTNAGPAQIDLTRYYNYLLTESWRFAAHECSMSEVPRGLVTLAGTLFDVRGVVQFSSRDKVDERYAETVRGIPIDRQLTRMHFLHSGRLRVRTQTTVSFLTVTYADGIRKDVPIRYGVEALDWWFHPKITAPVPAPPPLVIAWEGSNEEFTAGGARLRLFKYTWENPRPDVAVKSVDVVSQRTDFSHFIVALTVE